VLVVGPPRVASEVWSTEVRKWQHLRHLLVVPLVGTPAQRQLLLRSDAQIFTISYELVPWLVEHCRRDWGMVVADESTKLKGFRIKQGAKRAHALATIAHKTPRWLNLTGRPAPNGLKDLWGQTWFLDGGTRLGRSYSAFQDRWFQAVPGGDGYTQIEPLPYAQQQIQERLRDICLTIDPKDYFDLAEPIVTQVWCDLPATARTLYKQMEKDFLVQINGHDIEAVNAGAKSQKCLQLANGAVYTESGGYEVVHDRLMDGLESVINEANGMPVLLGYQFKSDWARIKQAYSHALDLSTPNGLAAFRTGKHLLGCAHPLSLGHGVDGLQDVTNILVFWGASWDLDTYEQMVERIGPVRQMQSGHDRPVFIYNIMARSTLHEVVLERREGKKSVQSILLNYMKRTR
jgi:SNF2 family DNA or RNA helicase